MLFMKYIRRRSRAAAGLLACFLALGAVDFAHADPRIDLLEAVKADDGEAVARLLRRGVSPNTREREYGPAPLMAAQLRAYQALRSLAASTRVDLNVANAKDETPLMLVSIAGELELVRLLVKRGAEVNRPNWTPLHYAASAGHVPIIRHLIDHFAYIDAQSPNGTTPLMMAARHKHVDAMRLLVEMGADPNGVNEAGLRAADYMDRVGEPEQAAWLRERAADYLRRYGTVDKPVMAEPGGATGAQKPAN